uniref:Uncharacterized protein n=1 Tax=Oryza rufipogon TaxID=4529 RepID=A0A0E0QGY8_ORYRU
MDRLVHLHFGGCVVEKRTGGSHFEMMIVRQLVLGAKPTYMRIYKSVGIQEIYDVGADPMSYKYRDGMKNLCGYSVGSQFNSFEVFSLKKECRESTNEFLDLNRSMCYCHEPKNDVFVADQKEEEFKEKPRYARKEEVIEEDVMVGEEVPVEEDVEMVDDNHVENEMGGELDDRQMASNSNGDRPVGKLLEEERKVFEEIVGCNSEISQFEDLGNAG